MEKTGTKRKQNAEYQIAPQSDEQHAGEDERAKARGEGEDKDKAEGVENPRDQKKNRTLTEKLVKLGAPSTSTVNAWAELLAQTTVKDSFPAKDILFLNASDTLQHALSRLSERNVLSAPVVEDTSSPEARCLGFIDVLDIAGFIVQEYEHRPDRSQMFQTPIRKLLNFSRYDDTVIIREGANLRHLLTLFCDPAGRHHGRLHRLAVAQGEATPHQAGADSGTHSVATLTNIVSQSDFISFAWKHADIIPGVDHTIEKLKLVHTSLLVRLDSAFIDALIMLYRNRVSGLALIDGAGHISGCLSASDLRGITAESFDYFEGSTLQFLVKGTQSKMKPLVSCGLGNTLRELLQLFATEHVHRVFVEDNSGHILGIVTLTDVLHVLLRAALQA